MFNNTIMDWDSINQEQPDFKKANYFAALVGFNLMAGGELKELKQPHYTVGLAYISGMFAIGRHIQEELLLNTFLNDKVIFDSLKAYVQINPDSPYKGHSLSFDNDEDLVKFLAYAEAQTKEIFTEFKKMLLG